MDLKPSIIQFIFLLLVSERTAQRAKVESKFDENKVKKRKRYKKLITKMFTNDEGEMGEV